MHADPPMKDALVELLWRAAIEAIVEAERAAQSGHLRIRARVPVDKTLRPRKERARPPQPAVPSRGGKRQSASVPLPSRPRSGR